MRRSTTGPISYPLYMAALATSLCGLLALSADASDKTATILASILLFVGYAASITLRKLQITIRLIELGVVAVAVLIYAQVIAGSNIGIPMLPTTGVDSPELKLASMLMWLEVVRSFTLHSDESLLFTTIPAIVMISLATTSNFNSIIIVIFVAYFVLATFLLSYRQQARTTGTVVNQFRVSLVTAIVALVLAVIAVFPVQTACTTAFRKAMPGFMRVRDASQGTNTQVDSFMRISQGPVSLSETLAFEVRLLDDQTAMVAQPYWRGRVFDRYTGHGWDTTASYTPVVPTSVAQTKGGHVLNVFQVATADGKREFRQQFISYITPDPVLYAAAEPVMVASGDTLVSRNQFNCWHRRRMGSNAPGRYAVASELPITDPGRLRTAGTNYPIEITSTYLQTLTSTAKVAELARDVTRDYNTPYDKARAIESFVGRRCIYDLNAPPAPNNTDAVDYFLFTSQRGYCDVFASAMVVMCRSVGIPARIATGFATGEYNSKIKGYVVRESDRHAWAEVYFPNCGWVTFDPTSLTSESDETWLDKTGKSIQKFLSTVFGNSTAVPVTVLILATFAIIAFGPQLMSARPRRRNIAPSKLHAKAVKHYVSIARMFGKPDLNKTPMEWINTNVGIPDEARHLSVQAASIFYRIRYSAEDVTADDLRELAAIHRELKHTLRTGSSNRRRSEDAQ